MLDLLAESPILISVMLLAIAAGMIFGWLQTGKRQTLWVALCSLLLIPVAHWIAARWETDREQIENLLYELAEAVQENDVERAVRVIGDSDMQARARTELLRYRFDMAAINKVRSIRIIEGTFPQEADVELSVKVDVSDRQGRFTRVRVLRLLLLKMEQRGSSWFVTDYQHFPITGQPDAASQISNQLSR